LQQSVSQFFQSRVARALAVAIGLVLFYFLGVIVRQHSGVHIIIRNESGEPVRQLSVGVESSADQRTLRDLMPGDHESAFVKTVAPSSIVVGFEVAGQRPHSADVFNYEVNGDCGASIMRILPQRRTESVESHKSVCWNSWLDFL
jgi:hypothetical protein